MVHSDSDSENEWELREVRRPAGTHRSRSTETPGADRELLRENGTNRNLGPSESRPVDEEALRQRYQNDPTLRTSETASMPIRDLSPGQKALADAFVEFGGIVIRDFVTPIIQSVVVPAAKAKLSELAERKRTSGLERAQAKLRRLSAYETDAGEPASAGTSVVIAEPAVPMKRSDFVVAQLQVKIAEDYLARKLWLLAHATVDDEDVPPELAESFTALVEGREDQLDDKEREMIAVYVRLASRSVLNDRELPSDLS